MSGETWKKSVSSVSETVFPGISLHEKPGLQSEIVSSLPLQMSLYFNVFFFPVWLATTVVMMTVKVSSHFTSLYNYSHFKIFLIFQFECLTSLYRFIAVTVQVSATGIEILRIYLGYFGNLTEKIPEVAGFWMLSILLQLPLQTFLIANRELLLEPIEYTVQTIMLILLISQLIIGYFALRLAARHQAMKFHLMQFQTEKKSEVNLGFENDHED